jgi:hypothetical protein
MPRLDTVLVLLLAMPAASFANTDTAPSAIERGQDRRQLAVDRGWAERDARELREFEQLTASLRNAYRKRMTGRYREVNARLQLAMAREIEQSSVKADQAKREAQLSGRELQDERMEAGLSGETRDVIQSDADRRDLRDDNAFIRHAEMARIGTMAGALQNQIEHGQRSAMQRNVALLDQFLKVMRSDNAVTRKELVEDRSQVREDRREASIDRR